MGTLRQDIFAVTAENYPRRSSQFVWKTLCALNLPVPQRGQFLQGSWGCIFLFMAPYGMVLRFSREPIIEYQDHPRIVQPFLHHARGYTHVELVPAVSMIYAPPNHMIALHDALAQDGLHFWDNKNSNVGYIWTRSGPQIVVLDRGACHTHGRRKKKWGYMRDYTPSGPVTPLEKLPANFQRQHYARVHEWAADLLPDFSGGVDAALRLSDPKKLQRFWSLCRAEVARRDGVLVNPWGVDGVWWQEKHQDKDPALAWQAAQAYQNVIR